MNSAFAEQLSSANPRFPHLNGEVVPAFYNKNGINKSFSSEDNLCPIEVGDKSRPYANYEENDEGFERFLDQASAVGRLTTEEEVELSKRIKLGDIEARNKLVEHNILLAVYIAKRYAHTNLPLSEITQHGILGLIRAADKYEYQGNGFSTYAVCWIRRFIQELIDNKEQAIHIPPDAIQKAKQVRKAVEEFGDLQAAAEHVGIPPTDAIALLQATKRPVSLNVSKYVEGDELGDTVPSQNTDTNPEYSLLADEEPDIATLARQERIKKLLKNFPKAEREKMLMRLGVEGDGKPMSDKEIADELRIKEESVTRGLFRARQRLEQLQAA